ncbi:MAG: branched-chain amino acid transport system permease protein livM, partial [Acidimicrobiaceae bacterium]|nr:branched-chain amino acid transport system permease protein livM [Acidimicrobiaceae bacterium]
MNAFLGFTIGGIVFGAVYAVIASGLVVTYTTSGIFNFAHGAIGMLMGFAYWELRVHQHWPAPIALFVVLIVLAPLLGALIERVLIRQLDPTDTSTTLVVTLGLLLALMGVAYVIWDAQTSRTVPEFFAGSHVRLGHTSVSYHELITIALAIAVAIGLRLLFFSTRLGVAMRAVVDDRDLAALNGARPSWVSQLSWILGSSLAAIGGILLAPKVGLDVLGLTFLVVNGFAAAMLGRLRNLPLTFLGALLLGLAENYTTGYVLPHMPNFLANLRTAIPTLMLFVILIALPQVRLRAGRLVGARVPRVPSARASAIAAVAFVAVAWLVAGRLSGGDLNTASQALSVGIIGLSMV